MGKDKRAMNLDHNGQSDDWQDVLDRMSAEAVRELNTMRHPSAGASLKAAAKKMLGRPSGYEASKDAIFWPAGMLLLGLLEAGHDREVRDYLSDWFEDGMPVKHPDDALTGEVLLRLCGMEEKANLLKENGKPEAESGGSAEGSMTSEEKEYQEHPNQADRMIYRSQYRQGAEQIYEYLRSCRRDAEGTIVYGQESSNNYIFADGVGQTVLFLSHYGRLFHVEEASREARRQMSNFLRHGIDERSGLPYHGYEAKSGTCYGIIGWGRAVGWLLFGLTELVRDSGPYQQVSRQMTDAALRRIRNDRMFSWQLDCMKGPADTSATGMILWSMGRLALNSEYDDVNLQNVLDRGAEALIQCVDAQGRVGKTSAECVDFGEYRQIYGHYPWGQGAALMFLGAHEGYRK